MRVARNILAGLAVLGLAQSAFAQTAIYRSPDHQLKALVIPVGSPGFEKQESKVEIRNVTGRLIRWRSFASDDGQHGRGVEKAAWTPDSRFFVFSTQSSGGHQPWNWATYFYSQVTNKFYRLDDYVGPITSSFELAEPNRLKTTRYNFGSKTEREPVTVRLERLIKVSQ